MSSRNTSVRFRFWVLLTLWINQFFVTTEKYEKALLPFDGSYLFKMLVYHLVKGRLDELYVQFSTQPNVCGVGILYYRILVDLCKIMILCSCSTLLLRLRLLLHSAHPPVLGQANVQRRF